MNLTTFVLSSRENSCYHVGIKLPDLSPKFIICTNLPRGMYSHTTYIQIKDYLCCTKLTQEIMMYITSIICFSYYTLECSSYMK